MSCGTWSISWAACAAALAIAALAGCETSVGGGAGPGVIDSGIGSIADARPEPDAAPLIDAAPPDARPPCVEGDLRLEDQATGTCYLYFDAALSWEAARAACLAVGGHLAAPTSLVENAFLSQIAPDNREIWIGASDLLMEDVFVWVTGEPFVFDHWREGEPNDGGQNGENCAVIEGQNNIDGEGCEWDDRDCDDPFPYLCERP
jgi:hypothetical protein